jgi:hypothetical protein
MVRVALATAFVTSLLFVALATPVDHVTTVPLRKVAKATFLIVDIGSASHGCRHMIYS